MCNSNTVIYGVLYMYCTVYGCPDMAPVPDAEMKRSGNTLMVRCNGSGETWYLTCRDTQWVGETGNCSYGKDEPGQSIKAARRGIHGPEIDVEFQYPDLLF